MISGVALSRAAAHPAGAVRVSWLFGVACAITMCTSPRVLGQDCASTTAGHAVEVEYEREGAAVGIPATLRFTSSHDGTLRAEDVATGSELWTFRPPEAEAAMSAGARMTSLAVLRFDSNADGVIDPRDGDRVWLYFGLKRAGAFYYALDVTAKTPRLLWRADSSTLHGLGDAWSTPTVARVRVSGARQNGEHLVLFVGGGLAGSASSGGNTLFMLDAASGGVLWTAGNDVPADFISMHMTEGFASAIVAIDFDGEHFTDRLYASDVGGRVWRFDIWNGRGVDQLVTGGVFASLGAREPRAPTAAAPIAADARHFFVAPDVAYIRPRGEPPYYNLSLGSGDAANLAAVGVQERFYALRDHAPFKRFTQPEYGAMSPIFDSDLPGPRGWKLDLAAGEHVVTDAITLNGVTLFTTFKPANSTDELCEATGTNRVYVVKVADSSPALDLDADGQISDSDESEALEGSTRPQAPRIEIVRPGSTDMPPGDPRDAEPPRDVATARCRIGDAVLKQCVPIGRVMRIFWKRTTVN